MSGAIKRNLALLLALFSLSCGGKDAPAHASMGSGSNRTSVDSGSNDGPADSALRVQDSTLGLEADLSAPVTDSATFPRDSAVVADSAKAGPCTTSADCSSGQVCGFLVTVSCGATVGACITPSTSGPTCIGPGGYCTCNGAPADVFCVEGSMDIFASSPTTQPGCIPCSTSSGCGTDEKCVGGMCVPLDAGEPAGDGGA